jgi:hypothetical protein
MAPKDASSLFSQWAVYFQMEGIVCHVADKALVSVLLAAVGGRMRVAFLFASQPLHSRDRAV